MDPDYIQNFKRPDSGPRFYDLYDNCEMNFRLKIHYSFWGFTDF